MSSTEKFVYRFLLDTLSKSLGAFALRALAFEARISCLQSRGVTVKRTEVSIGRLERSKAAKVCVLLSGGLDSSVLTAVFTQRVKQVHPIYVRTGLLWENAELYWVKRFLAAIASSRLAPLKEIQLPLADVYDSHWSLTGDNVPDHLSDDQEMYLPGRNLILLAKTSLYCALNQLSVIALGPLKANPFPDSTAGFFAGFQELASQALTYELKIIAPFSSFSKTKVVRLGRDLPLYLTFSCARPVRRQHCGACNKCAERRRSFILAGIEDLTRYHSLPPL
jgi:7-cyano-7-deazaguanine synthase